jgi:acetyl esterase/lipase
MCAPSAGGLEENALPIVVAAMGYAVAAPDYLGMAGFGEPSGMLHPYLVPEATAVATLDSARAAANFVAAEQPGASVDLGRTVLWGGSEGGFAAVWSERYAAEYLPEASIAATVALVPPTDLTALAQAALAAPIEASAGLVGAWVGQHSWYAAPGHDLSEVLLDPIAEALPGEMMQSCSDFPSMEGLDTLEAVFQPSVLQAAADSALGDLDPWSCYLGLGDLHGARVPRGVDPPVLVVVSEADDLVVAATVRDSIPVLCGDGYDIDYLECAGASHTEGAVKSLPYQFEWVRDRLADIAQDPAEVCAVDVPFDCDQFLDIED